MDDSQGQLEDTKEKLRKQFNTAYDAEVGRHPTARRQMNDSVYAMLRDAAFEGLMALAPGSASDEPPPPEDAIDKSDEVHGEGDRGDHQDP